MSETKATPAKWTEADKLGILFQIISASNDKIPWDKISLPEGRTLKAVQVMLDKEKAKVREWMKAKQVESDQDGDDAPPTPAPTKGKKRTSKAAANADGGATPKKARAPRGKKAAPQAEPVEGTDPPIKSDASAGAEDEEVNGSEALVKPEGEDEGEADESVFF